MNLSILYSSPAGDEIQNPSLDFLGDVLNKDYSWWQTESGDVGLTCSSPDKGEAELILIKSEEEEIFVQHSGFGESVELVLAHTLDKSERTEICVGGEPIQFPRDYFVQKDIALQAIDEFCKTGNRALLPEGYKWKKVDF